MKTQTHPHRFTRATVFMFFLMLAPLGEAYAQSPCRVGFLSRSAPTVDGDNAVTGTTHEWDDASVITSGDPCFGFLIDQNGVTPGSPVRVFTKRYARTMGGPEFLGFYVEVMDVSDTGVLTTGTVSSGEKFVIQFDPNHSGGMALGGTSALDFRVIVNHAWLVGGSGIDIQATLSDSSFNTGCGSVQNWTAGTAATGLVVAARRMTGGYKFELEIPTQLVGITGAFPTIDIGVAFAAINDFGRCMAGMTGGGCPNSSYAAFPSDITMTATDNPVTGCHRNWIIPDRWASSSSTAPPPGGVFILRTPDWWKSSSLVAYQCGSTSPGYTYYARHPCRVELKATLENTSGSTQSRNLVFLWSPAGSGEPEHYNFISLISVEVPNGATQGPFTSGSWSGMPTGLDNQDHPCVRVYILPAVLRTDFGGDVIRAITTRAQKDDMVLKYGLIDGDWAQKNITRHEMELDCSGGTACYAARNNTSDPSNIARQEIASLSQQPAPFLVRGGPNAMQSGNNVVEQTSAPIVTYPVSSSVQQSDPQNRPPVMSNPGNRISMAANEFEAFHRENVIVQVRTFETEQPTQSSPSHYRFVQPTGGVIQLFPVKMLEQQLAIPFQFNVTGMAPIPGGGPRILNLAVDLLAPPNIAPDVEIAIDTSPQPIGPYELRVIRGVLVLKSQTGGGPFKRWGLSLHGGISIPHGDLNLVSNKGPNFGVDLEYRFNQLFSLEWLYGFHHFPGETFGGLFTIDDLNVHQLSVNSKIYGSTSPVRPFFNFGGGAYWFQPDATVHGGLNVGAGIQFDVKPNIAVEGVYNFHNIVFSGVDARFSTVQAGVRFRF
jgi:hypothetical protein